MKFAQTSDILCCIIAPSYTSTVSVSEAWLLPSNDTSTILLHFLFEVFYLHGELPLLPVLNIETVSLNVMLGFRVIGGSKFRKLFEFVFVFASSNFDRLTVSFSLSASHLIDARLYVDRVFGFSLRNLMLGRLPASWLFNDLFLSFFNIAISLSSSLSPSCSSKSSCIEPYLQSMIY